MPVYGFTTFVKYDDTSHARSEEVNTNDARRDFHARSVVSSVLVSNITEFINFVDKLRFIIDPKFLSMEKILIIEKPQN